MTDLTKITTPFGLLDAETQRALRNCPHGWERFGGEEWTSDLRPRWFSSLTYRAAARPGCEGDA